ncbi:MAG: YqeG family HAD IIIA-type phosphatase [Prevotella sp.]|nr:YqeG family HAD IIIA-type phosphatase [Prevotella sp.]
MFKKYYPYEYTEDVFCIDYAELYRRGYRAILFDIDNTLVAHGADSTEEIDELFRKIHATGLKTLLLSNNNVQRIQRFNQNIGTAYIQEAGKPNPSCYLKALEMLGVEKQEAIVVGDQIFTDIYGANRAGLASILVKYIGFYKREWKGYTRYIEKAVLFCYSLSGKNRHRLGKVTQ